MRRVRSHFGDSAPAGGSKSNHLCQGASARGAVGAGDRNMVAGFADRADKRGRARFPALWEKMCRKSFQTYASYLGMAGNPVEWTDRYILWDDDTRQTRVRESNLEELPFAHYGQRVADLNPRFHEFAPGTHPFPTRNARWSSSLTFNIASYSRQLTHDFLVEGGRIERMEFHSPGELHRLPQKVVINATGYGARELWKDESIVPVRGQIAWLIPQHDVNYGVFYKGIQNPLAKGRHCCAGWRLQRDGWV